MPPDIEPKSPQQSEEDLATGADEELTDEQLEQLVDQLPAWAMTSKPSPGC